MRKRVCYAQDIPSINGRESLMGRLLYDHLDREFDICLCDCVLSTDVVDGIYNISPEDFHTRKFEAVYIEGGLYWGSGSSATPKFELDALKPFVHEGGIVIVADVGRNEATQKRDQSPYSSARDLFGAAPNWGSSGDELRYGVDFTNNLGTPGEVIAIPDQMFIDPWLVPVYQGIDRLLALQALALDTGGAAILATGNSGSSQVLAVDMQVDEGLFNVPFTFATVRQVGLGYVVLIAGLVSGDFAVEQCPDNARWISNLIRFLSDEAGRERQRRARGAKGGGNLTLPLDEWAAELGKLAEDQNWVELRLRALVDKQLSAHENQIGEPGWATNTALRALDGSRRSAVDGTTIDAVLGQMYWRELVAVLSNNWKHFESVFSDKKAFQGKADILNDRPHAHAKSIDAADVALYRRELAWFRSRLEGAN